MKILNRYRLTLSYQLIVLSSGLLFTLMGCSSVRVPDVGDAVSGVRLSPKQIERLVAKPPPSQKKLIAEHTELPREAISNLEAGDTNTYGVVVTETLAMAYKAYLMGEGDRGIDLIESRNRNAENAGLRWQFSFLKVQTYLMMGQAANAEIELDNTARYEIAFVGHDLNSTALRAEVRIWLEDFDNALNDLAVVIQTVGDWELPISYYSFPTNREQLYMFTTAKLRAYTTLTSYFIFQEQYGRALIWGRETERLFNNVFFVTGHPLYGMGDKPLADAYYGRAMNLTFYASAVLAVSKQTHKADAIFKRADTFYDKLGYDVGKVTTLALKARIYNRLGMKILCYKNGQAALKLAVASGLPDYVWRIGVLSGESLLSLGRKEEAEMALRQAQASVDLISGGLSSDRAKTRFGVGKEDITYHLAKIDLEKGDYDTLFQDLENGRARAFMDLLRDRPEMKNRQATLMKRINDVEKEIRNERLKNLAFSKEIGRNRNLERDLMRSRDDMVHQLKQIDPDLSDMVAITTSPLLTVQRKMRKGDVILYALPLKPNDKIQFLRISPDKVSVISLAVSGSDIQKQLDDFTFATFDPEMVERREMFIKNWLEEDEEPIAPEEAIGALKEAFIPDQWNVGQIAYVVPTGILHFVPWAVLDTPFPISTLPNGAWLTRASESHGHKNDIAIIGDPYFGDQLPQLAGARKEARLIGQLYGSEPLIGDTATESNLRKSIGDGVSTLHLATHGRFDTVHPLKSAIYLSKQNEAFPLTAKEIYENPLPARLVVLSACETGLGKTVAGDDLLGLSRGFFLGGTRAILSSLWEIEDEGTREFMLVFHKEARKGDLGQAWIAARNRTKEKGFPASVYGAFNLSGQID